MKTVYANALLNGKTFHVVDGPFSSAEEAKRNGSELTHVLVLSEDNFQKAYKASWGKNS